MYVLHAHIVFNFTATYCTHIHSPGQVNSLNTKTRALRRDKEEAEGEVETSKSKLRQLRAQVEEAEENASSLQAQVTKLRSASRKKVGTLAPLQ